MILSLDRIPSVSVINSSFGNADTPNSGGRGMLTSAHGVEIVGNTFKNLCSNNNLLFLNGGCGAYEDYTEGPFSKDVYIAGNTFDRSKCETDTSPPPTGQVLNTAMLQWSGCHPQGMCESSIGGGKRAGSGGQNTRAKGETLALLAEQPYPLPPCEEGGTTQPPVVPHAWTPGSGPGRIQEAGGPLSGLNTKAIFSNITVVNNTFYSPGYRFMDFGLVEGVSISGNTMLQAGGAGAPVVGGDVRIARSHGFNVDAIARNNKCFAVDESHPRACLIVNGSSSISSSIRSSRSHNAAGAA